MIFRKSKDNPSIAYFKQKKRIRFATLVEGGVYVPQEDFVCYAEVSDREDKWEDPVTCSTIDIRDCYAFSDEEGFFYYPKPKNVSIQTFYEVTGEEFKNVRFENCSFREYVPDGVFTNCVFKDCTFQMVMFWMAQKNTYIDCSFWGPTMFQGKGFFYSNKRLPTFVKCTFYDLPKGSLLDKYIFNNHEKENEENKRIENGKEKYGR